MTCYETRDIEKNGKTYRVEFHIDEDVGEIRAEAVCLDLERMAGWCNNDWYWCGIAVFPLTDDGDELRSKAQSLCGIESDAGPYFDEVIAELIAQIEV